MKLLFKLAFPQISRQIMMSKIHVIVHEVGHGVQSYLDDLVNDITKTGFTPVVSMF